MADSRYATSFRQARNYYKGRAAKVRLIVIHDMEAAEKATTAENIAAYFAGPQAPVASAHYNVDNDSIAQSVHETDTAFHAPGMNADGIGIEHAGYARQTRTDWLDAYSTAMLKRSAQLTADIATRYGIPIVHLTNDQLRAGAKGFVGHYQGSQVYRGSHTDPGNGFPWDVYLQWVREAQAAQNGTTTPVKPVTPSKPTTAGSFPVLRQGSTGAQVSLLQAWLLRMYPSYAKPAGTNGKPDGSYGPGMIGVVKEWQKRMGLAVDGVFGPASLAAARKAGFGA